MKHFLFILSFFALLSHHSHANDALIPTPLLQSFYSSFTDAEDVRWEKAGKLTVASFFSQGKKKFAYYNQSAELVVLAELISVDQLPENMRRSFQQNFGRQTVSDLFLLKDAQGISYHAIFETAKDKIFVKSTDESWEIEKQVRK